MGDLTFEPRVVPLGGVRGLEVRRTLPSKGLPTIGGWCFLDHFGPTRQTMEVLPHPHTGLQTVTWPLDGPIRHRDNLGSNVVLKPGELNIMTSGDGVSHSEFSEGPPAQMHGIQFWVALPEDRRHGPADFEHFDDLPIAEGNGWQATVFVGEFGGVSSPAKVYSPLVGAELRFEAGNHEIELNPDFEHGLLAIDATVELDGQRVDQHSLRYLTTGRNTLKIDTYSPTTIVLLGGKPWDEPLVMWWNFVGRSHEEIVEAREEWEANSDRFGHVDGHDGKRIPAPPMPPVRLKPRIRHL